MEKKDIMEKVGWKCEYDIKDSERRKNKNIGILKNLFVFKSS